MGGSDDWMPRSRIEYHGRGPVAEDEIGAQEDEALRQLLDRLHRLERGRYADGHIAMAGWQIMPLRMRKEVNVKREMHEQGSK